MTRRLRHEDPRCGREHFDLIAGMEWECGVDPNDISGSTPDVRWGEYWRRLDAPRILFGKGQWRVTNVGLEVLSDSRERYERYEIQADRLLDMHERGPVYRWPILVANEPWADFDDFETAFREAIEIFHRRRSSAPTTMDWWINYRLAQQRPDSEILDRTFRQARGMARRRARDGRVKRNLPPRLPKIRDAIIINVERLLYASTDVWLRCQGPKDYQAVFRPRPATANDVRVITAAYPTFFSSTFEGPQAVYCAACWERNDWFLLECERPSVA